MKSKKTIALFMLMTGLSGITTQAVTQATNGDNDLYALVYPSSTGPLSNLYNSNATAQDEIDKFLNNQPSLLDAFNGGTADSPGLGTRKLYLFRITAGPISAMQSMSNTYIYYDTTNGCPKIHYEGQIRTLEYGIYTSRTSTTGDLNYKKVLVDNGTAKNQGWQEITSLYYNYSAVDSALSTAYIKIKTSDENADQGGLCYYGDASLQLGSITISGYKMPTLNDYFLPVYQTSTTAITAA